VSYKRTLVFFAIFAALAAFFYFYEIKGGEERRLSEEQEKLLLSFQADQATRLILSRAGDEIILERPDGNWQITAPVSAPTEEGAIAQVLDAAAGLKFERDIGTQSDLKPFGLSEPELGLEIGGEHKMLGKILLGAETPDGSNLYLKLSDMESVFIVNKSIKAALDKTLFELRDKKVVDFSPGVVTAMSVVRDDKLLAFERPNERDWSMTFPEERRADAGKIRGLLDSIRNARVAEFVDEDASDLQKYGLMSPSTRIELNLVSEIAVLYFGDKTGQEDSDNVFVRRGDSRQVLELAANILDNVSVEVNDWRDRTMLDFDKKEVVKLQVVSGTRSTTVERPGKDANDWRVTEPEPAEADRVKVKDILTYLYSTKVIRFLPLDESEAASRALESPVAQVKIWMDQGEDPLTLSLGEKEEEGEVYAMTDSGDEFSIVNANLLEELVPDPERLPERFKDKSVIRFAAADIEKIEIAKGEKSYSIERKDVKWELPDDLEMEAYEVDRFLWSLQQLDYISIAPKEHDDSLYGFDVPTVTINMQIAETDDELSLTIGKRIPERGSFYVLGSDEHIVMEIGGEFATEWFDRF
jgi:hypothetical protein